MAKNDISCDCDVLHQEAVDRAKAVMPTEERFFELADFFKVIGDSTRSKILWALDNGEMCVCDLAEHLGMTKSAVSHQLATLKEAHFVLCHREGKHIRYRLADDHVAHILSDGLAHICEPEEEETK